jgi:RHS repeat-associated protein
VAEYTYYPGLDNVATVLRHDRADSTYYYIQNHAGNVLALLARTSSGVTIDDQYRYDPFGNPQGSSPNPVPNTLEFAGREYDTETQLYYDRARYLDPAIGRFVSEDPIGLHGGVNLYAFVGNDPVNRSDPSGTTSIWKAHIDVETPCGEYPEPFVDAAEHLGLGYALVNWGPFKRLEEWLGLTPVGVAFAAGMIHEGPWWDGDLTRSQGAPCNGIGDIFLFMAVPLASARGGWGPNPFPWGVVFPNGLPNGYPWPPGWGPIL